MNKVISIFICFVLLSLCGCATVQLKPTDFSYTYTEINATKEITFNSLVKIINEQDLPIQKANQEMGYINTEYIDTLTGIRKGVVTILSTTLSGVTAQQYAYIFEIHNTENLNKNILVIRVLYRWKRLGGGFQYFTNTKKMSYYKEAEEIAVKTKKIAEGEK